LGAQPDKGGIDAVFGHEKGATGWTGTLRLTEVFLRAVQALEQVILSAAKNPVAFTSPGSFAALRMTMFSGAQILAARKACSSPHSRLKNPAHAGRTDTQNQRNLRIHPGREHLGGLAL